MTAKRRSNVIRFQRPRFSIGTVLFFLIFLYVILFSVHFLNKEHITIYEVNEKQMSDNNTTVGIAVRTEEVYKAPSSGYINFYNSKGSKVGKGNPVFSVDQSGSVNDLIQSMDSDVELSADDINSIRTTISSYRDNFNFSSYGAVYDFKYNIESEVLSFLSEKTYSKLSDMTGNSSFSVTNASTSGVVAYQTDNMEGITADSISADSFNEENYTSNVLKTSDSVTQGEAVCRIATSEDWSIVIKLNEEQYAKLDDKERVRIRFCKDNIELSLPFRTYSAGTDNFAELYMSDYLSRYIDERFIKIELLLNSAEGLKIPVSSLVEKSCYIVPVNYLMKGADSDEDIISYEVIDENGSKGSEPVSTFAYIDDEYVYIDAVLLQPGLYIINPDSDEKFQLGEMRTLKGVYNVNEGFCQFKQVEILYENKEYCIVKNNTRYGLSVYDHIVVNPELISEDDIIF